MNVGAIDQLSIVSGPVPVVVGVIAVIAFVALVWPLSSTPRSQIRRVAQLAAGAGTGALFGVSLVWLLVDVLDVLHVGLSVGSRAWITITTTGIGIAIASLIGSRWGRRVIAAGSVLVFLCVGVLGVNADIGQYPTVGSAIGSSTVQPIPPRFLGGTGSTAVSRPLWSSWQAPSSLPAAGLVGTAIIPATVSGFVARPAFVYLPPAALVDHPPTLPVIVMMSGQPGSPQNVFEAGHLEKVFNTFALSHGGLAPIVVVPDQLGSPNINPMCSNAWAGNVETYLTVDVPNWIRGHLGVARASSSWAIAGWSQGGTCAIQLGAGHPEIFGNIIDISGESVPSLGTVDQTVSRGFAGNRANYNARRPADIIAARAPYQSMVAVFGWGQGDSKFGPGLNELAQRARSAAMTVTTSVSPGTAHDWSTVRFVMTHGIDPVFVNFGIVNPVG